MPFDLELNIAVCLATKRKKLQRFSDTVNREILALKKIRVLNFRVK